MWDMPYFMSNRLWYRFDFNVKKFVLTKRAPDKAKKSYAKYLKRRKD